MSWVLTKFRENCHEIYVIKWESEMYEDRCHAFLFIFCLSICMRISNQIIYMIIVVEIRQ